MEAAMTQRPAATKELQFLQFIAQRGPMSVGQVAETLGVELGLARTTVQTILERLRRKGHLTRRREDSVFVYSSPATYNQLTLGVVRRFVDHALAGSVSPFVAYLAEQRSLDAEDIRQLREVVKRLDTHKGGRS
jgi:predicted transcriptional regulator